MKPIFVILEDNHPSLSHYGYISEAEAKAETERLNKIRDDRNQRIRDNPATGRGSAFMNVISRTEWTYVEKMVPDEAYERIKQQREGSDQVQLDKGFTITCRNCGSEAAISNSLGMGSSQTGMYGSIELRCSNPECNQTESVYGS